MKSVLFQIILAILAVALLVDLGVLNWKILVEKKVVQDSLKEIQTEVLPTPQGTRSSGCPDSCLSQIYEATSSLKLPTAAPQAQSVPAAQNVKEFFVPFGSGSTKAGDWEDTTGLTAYIDSTKYGKIKSVVFEAAVYIPNGNQGVYVRLFNATDKHPVWFSEVYHEGGVPKLLTSQPITLDSGNKLYQVQMKTTLKDLANLNQARVKITTE